MSTASAPLEIPEAGRPPERPAPEDEQQAGEFIARQVLERDASFFDG